MHRKDLRYKPFKVLRCVYTMLGMPVAEHLRQVVKKHAWERVPESKKGEGKLHRKAKPREWREDLTPRQVEIVERITAPFTL